ETQVRIAGSLSGQVARGNGIDASRVDRGNTTGQRKAVIVVSGVDGIRHSSFSTICQCPCAARSYGSEQGLSIFSRGHSNAKSVLYGGCKGTEEGIQFCCVRSVRHPYLSTWCVRTH